MWLRDCVSKDPSEAELLLLCSEPAFEETKIDRNRMTQAILGVDQSFVVNDELFDVLDNEQCRSLIATLGVGIHVSGPPREGLFDIKKLRYERIIVVAEQGNSGDRVRKEILRFFSTYMRPLIDAGHVFVPEAPLEPPFSQNEFVEHILNPLTRRLITIDGEAP